MTHKFLTKIRYSVATGRAERDPSGDLRAGLPPAKGTRFAAISKESLGKGSALVSLLSGASSLSDPAPVRPHRSKDRR